MTVVPSVGIQSGELLVNNGAGFPPMKWSEHTRENGVGFFFRPTQAIHLFRRCSDNSSFSDPWFLITAGNRKYAFLETFDRMEFGQ